MAWTSTDLATIEAAIAQGTLRISFSDRTIEYRSISELLKARDAIKAAISGSSSGTMCTFAQFSKG